MIVAALAGPAGPGPKYGARGKASGSASQHFFGSANGQSDRLVHEFPILGDETRDPPPETRRHDERVGQGHPGGGAQASPRLGKVGIDRLDAVAGRREEVRQDRPSGVGHPLGG